jgi:hypothetical protein
VTQRAFVGCLEERCHVQKERDETNEKKMTLQPQTVFSRMLPLCKWRGVGECREQFMKLVNDIEQGKFDIVIVASAQLLFVDTPLCGWRNLLPR